MSPSISEALKVGFKTAGRSWPGILCYVGSWVLAGLIGLAILLVSAPPVKLMVEEASKMRQETRAPADEEIAEGTAKPEPAALPNLSPEAEEKIGKWFQKGWPFLAAATLFMALAGLLLYGGQIGYLAKLVRGDPASFLDIWESGLQVFLPLLGTALLAFTLFGLPFLLVTGFGVFLSSFLPRWFAVVVVVLLILPLLVAAVWLGIRFFFWFIAVAADCKGPIEAFKTSLELTQGRWGWTFLFSIILTLIPVGVDMVFRLFQWLGTLAGSFVGGVFAVIFSLLGLVVGIYLPFFSAASAIRFYDEAKSRGAPI